MKVLVTIVYGPEEEATFPMSVGDGRKTFKWLGLAAAETFRSRAPRGRPRHRELFPSSSFLTNLAPVLVHSSEEEFYHPEDTLLEHLCDGQNVRVVLGHKLPLNKRSEPHPSPWTVIAFRRSERWGHDRAAASQSMQKQQEQRRIEHVEPEDKEKLFAAMQKADQMRDIMYYQLGSETRTRQCFEQDWIHMNSSGRLDQLVHLPEDQEEVRLRLLRHYQLLTELFRSFSSQGTGRLTKMDHREFGNAVNMLGMRAVMQEPQLLQRIYVDCLDAHVSEQQRMTLTLQLPEFMLALIHLSYAIYIDRQINKHLPSIPWAAIGRRRTALLNSTSTQVASIGDSMSNLLKDYLLPYATKNLTTFVVKDALASNAVLTIMGEMHETLLKVYRTYSKMTPGAYIYQSLMDIKEFYAACKDAKLFDKDIDEKVVPLMLKDIKSTFAFSQNNVGQDSSATVDATGDNEDFLSYPEYLETVARLGLLRLAEEERLSVEEKIKAGMKAMASLAHHQAPSVKRGRG